MPAKDLGTKHTCFKCQTRFYDLKKEEPICPKCGADQRHAPVVKAPPAEKRTRAPARPAAVVEPAVDEVEPEAEVEDDEAAADDEDEDEEP